MNTGGALPSLDTEPAGQEGDALELDETLLLVQAGMLKMMRFQLAIERQDRRGAMQAMDGVLTLERRLAERLEATPAFRFDREGSAASLDEDRAALAREKFTLAAGFSGSRAARLDGRVDRSSPWSDDGKSGQALSEPEGHGPQPDAHPGGRESAPLPIRTWSGVKWVLGTVALVIAAAAMTGALLDPVSLGDAGLFLSQFEALL